MIFSINVLFRSHLLAFKILSLIYPISTKNYPTMCTGGYKQKTPRMWSLIKGHTSTIVRHLSFEPT
ncbi:uncharacterized protein METZ01_LOCUS367993 [marine metagenome]|uniref:Uncharacterized protein n=1 Tax=marine metagenome TaxID=408172 RepID=A0A382SYZ3_9ZZZZ